MNIKIEVLEEKNFIQCRELCNDLMKFQKSKAYMGKEKFDSMNFETRMEPSYKNSLANYILLIKDEDTPVGYLFCTVNLSENLKKSPFQLVPKWKDIPEKIGHINNLYFEEKYRGTGLGKKMIDLSMEWFRNFSDVNLILVHVSNGNDEAYNFYIKKGFKFIHDILDGFIKCLYKYKEEK